ncbi:hypothetical protein AVEN_5653-1 [Araneus ventricosus]|uniref:Uncharacterized protein n=1 Tax=Araneus ventricosus TaxID=182803 RepID=A0A4Y2BLW8_ARAVE|nr:hypothetical protein AVEN_5653-1 [Araneus ventricosus]
MIKFFISKTVTFPMLDFYPLTQASFITLCPQSTVFPILTSQQFVFACAHTHQSAQTKVFRCLVPRLAIPRIQKNGRESGMTPDSLPFFWEVKATFQKNALHSGHELLLSSHLTVHSMWKACPHGSFICV